MAGLYSEGKQANQETADEIMNRLEADKNYIPSSVLARREYRHILLEMYQEYFKDKADKDQK